MKIDENIEGMTLRDYFAGIALSALLQTTLKENKITPEMMVDASYEIADLMILKKEKA